MKQLLAALITLTLFISCASTEDNQEPINYTAKNEKEITDYVAQKQLTAVKSDSGLYYVINAPGTGAQPTATSNVTVAYKGYFTNEYVFDQSSAEGVSFGLNQVIKGWAEGISHFKEGGSGILLIPSHLAYGSYDYYNIPGGSILIFNIKLLSVKN